MIHAVDAVLPIRLARYCGHEGGGYYKLLGECGAVGCGCRPQGSVPDVEAVYTGNDSPVRASDKDRGGPKIAVGIEADRSSQWVHPKISRIAVSPS